jgi:hypothetical protein
MSAGLLSILGTEVKLEASSGSNLIIKDFLLLFKNIKNVTPLSDWRT